jgi:hypothetical protein
MVCYQLGQEQEGVQGHSEQGAEVGGLQGVEAALKEQVSGGEGGVALEVGRAAWRGYGVWWRLIGKEQEP